MAKLPTVPNLDPDAPPPPADPPAVAVDPDAAQAAAEAAAALEVAAAAQAAANQAAGVDPAAAPADAEDPAAAPTAAVDPAAAQVAAAAAVADEASDIDVAMDDIPVDGDDAAAPSERPTMELGESFEEMLSQSSDHTLRLMNVEEKVTNLVDLLSDVREEMHAGVADLRSVMQTMQAAQQAAAPKPGHSLGPRIDDLDAFTRHAVGKVRFRTLILIIIQVLVLAGVGASLYLSHGGGDLSLGKGTPKGAKVSGMPEPRGPLPPSYTQAEEDEEPEVPKKKKKKKKR